MKFLMVKDNSTFAELAVGPLHPLGGQAQQIEAIDLASDRQTVAPCIPGDDAVPCVDTSPLSHKPLFCVEDRKVVWQKALRRGVHSVPYSGCIRALDCAPHSGALALAGPAVVEENYAALTHPPCRSSPKAPENRGESPKA